MFRIFIFIFGMVFLMISYAKSDLKPAITAPIPLANIVGFEKYPVPVKKLINEAYLLSKKNLTYLYDSADPKNGGMDCSGTMYYLLQHVNVNHVPRDSNEIFDWAEKKGKLYRVTTQDFSSKEFDKLQPGDLLFWSGTYDTNKFISHVMLYLGKNKQNKPLMFGASDGRTYQGNKMWGVSVFDFNLPNGTGTARFVGYSCIPDLTC